MTESDMPVAEHFFTRWVVVQLNLLKEMGSHENTETQPWIGYQWFFFFFFEHYLS